VQTFVPELTFAQIARRLDSRRLGRQRVEVLQILNGIVMNRQHGWKGHPVTKMWMKNPAGLAAYGVAICDEWIRRGYQDAFRDRGIREKIVRVMSPDQSDLPVWWGRDDIVLSHRSNLIRKFPEHYRPFWEGVPDDLPYVWAEV
jgi:hypothetical protein